MSTNESRMSPELSRAIGNGRPVAQTLTLAEYETIANQVRDAMHGFNQLLVDAARAGLSINLKVVKPEGLGGIALVHADLSRRL